MGGEFVCERAGVRLSGRDFGGEGPAVLLLHGLAGYAGEWAQTASWLTDRARVVAFDARGHGASERSPNDVSREAHLQDAVFVVKQLGLGPTVVVGQSLGGVTAMLFAARWPDLSRGLIVADASPAGGADDTAIETAVGELSEALKRWPVPFASREAAIGYFGGPSLTADAWVDGLEHRDDGMWPRFDVDLMARTLRDAASRSYWEQWQQIVCPTLVIRAGHGVIDAADAHAMVERGNHVTLVEFADAKHDLHLDRPDDWRHEVSKFLDRLETPAPG